MTPPPSPDRGSQKLALFLPSLRGGGAERMFVALANGFATREFAVDLVLAKATGPYLEEVGAGVRIVDLGATSVARAIPGLARYLRMERPDALLSGLSHANVAALVARRIAHVATRVVVSERNTFSAATGSRLHRVMGLLMRLSYPGADAITAVSKGVAVDLSRVLGVPAERVMFLYNPVVTADLLADAEKPLKETWVEATDSPIILGVGRLSPQKDFGTLLRAFARVRAVRPARLAILGEGRARGELQELARQLGCEDDVLLPGFQSNPFSWMKSASVFVLSSRWEGLPGALIQAMACGAPVVSTDCPSGPEEILEGGKWGALAPVGDDEAMARAILDTLDARDLPDVRLRAMDFDAEVAIDRHLEVLLPGAGAPAR
ncbi:MAG: glycosyltransferase [Dehalococcoidia bacterium]